jgi:hypothetical protein
VIVSRQPPIAAKRRSRSTKRSDRRFDLRGMDIASFVLYSFLYEEGDLRKGGR